MKKILLILILFLLMMGNVKANCKTLSYYKKSDNLLNDNLIKVLINVGEKLYNKDRSKVNGYLSILNNFQTKTERQKQIILVLKDYFICRENNILVNNNGDYYKLIYDKKDSLGNIGLKNQIKSALENNKTSISINFSDTYNGDIKSIGSINSCGTNGNNWCSTNWNYYKIYIPKESNRVTFHISSTPTRPTGSFVLMYKFFKDGETGVLDFTDYSLFLDNNTLFNNGKVIKTLFDDTKIIDLQDYQINKGGWLYIALSQNSYVCNEDKNLFSSCAVSRNLSISTNLFFENKLKISEFLNRNIFDDNGNPFVYNIDFSNLRSCNGVDNLFNCDQINLNNSSDSQGDTTPTGTSFLPKCIYDGSRAVNEPCDP